VLRALKSDSWLALLVVGAWITWPASASPWRDWRRVWRLRRGPSGLATLLSWHRGGGLWLWPLLAMLAVTGVVLGFEDRVRAAVAAVSPVSEAPEAVESAHGPVSASEAVAAARGAIAAAGFDAPLAYVSHARSSGHYRVRFGDAYAAGFREITVYVGSADGRVLGVATARGETAGDLLMNAVQPLHAGRIAGLPGRILVFVGGFAVAGLAISGAVMWAIRCRRPRPVGAAARPRTDLS